MNAKDVLRVALQMSHEWAMQAARDMADAPLTSPTARGGNHPMWVMGHAAHSEGGLLAMLTGETNPVEHWKRLFAAGSQPAVDAAGYPPYEVVLATFDRLRARTLEFIETCDEARFSAPPRHVPDEFKSYPPFQTVGALATFIAMHQMCHVGQLLDARRAAGRPPLN